MKTTKIYLADDHAVLREGLSLVINKFPGYEVIGQADHGKQLIEDFEKGIRPDIVILDIQMPVMDGYETAQWLKDNHPQVKVLGFTMYDTDVPLIQLLQRGARGVIRKDINNRGLQTAIETVDKHGYYYINPATGEPASFLNGPPGEQLLPKKGFFADDEIRFLQLCANDYAYKEMDEKLGPDARSVDTLRESLFKKLDVKTRYGLVVFAMKNGIVHF